MFANALIKQPASNAQDDTHDVRDPVVDVGAAIEAGLDQLNGSAKGARADEDRQQSEAPCARQREGECCEGYEVHELVGALRRRGRRLEGPEHRNGQGEGHNEGEGDVEVLAHATRLTAPRTEHKWKLSPGVFSVR